MLPNLTPDVALAERLFAELRARSFDGVGITREAYGPGERMAHALLAEAGDALGLERKVDPVGNMYLTLPGADRAAKRVILGSHLDSVQQGGNYDGAAGVLAGLRRRRRDEAGRLHARAATSPSWRSAPRKPAPGSRPATPAAAARWARCGRRSWRCSGSTAGGRWPTTCGTRASTPASSRRASGRSGRTASPPSWRCISSRGRCWMPRSIPIGIITGIPGSRRLRAGRVIGEWNHSGATPRKYRKDAAIALADLAVAMDEAWCRLEARGHHMVCTFCVLATAAGGRLHQDPRRGAFPARCPQRQPAFLRRAVRGALRQGRRDRGAARGEIRARRGGGQPRQPDGCRRAGRACRAPRRRWG